MFLLEQVCNKKCKDFVGNLPFLFVSAGNRQLLDNDDINDALANAQDEFNGLIDSFWGGKCIKDDQCISYVAYCDKTQGLSGSLGKILDGVFVQYRPILKEMAVKT